MSMLARVGSFSTCTELKVEGKLGLKKLIWGNLGATGAMSRVFQAYFFGMRCQIPVHFRHLYPFLNHSLFISDLCSLYREVRQTWGEKKRTEKRSYLRPAEVNGEPEYKPKTCQVPVAYFNNTAKKKICENSFLSF